MRPREGVYGLQVPAGLRRQRECISDVQPTMSGNVSFRVGREHDAAGGSGWQQVGYITITAEEAQDLAGDLREAAGITPKTNGVLLEQLAAILVRAPEGNDRDRALALVDALRVRLGVPIPGTGVAGGDPAGDMHEPYPQDRPHDQLDDEHNQELRP